MEMGVYVSIYMYIIYSMKNNYLNSVFFLFLFDKNTFIWKNKLRKKNATLVIFDEKQTMGKTV